MIDIDKLVAMALESNFTRAGELLASNLDFLEEVRGMCGADKCRSYNKSWICPPACGTLDEIRERASHFERGLIVQTVGNLEDSFDYEGMTEVGATHEKNFIELTQRIKEIYPNCLPMGAGGCRICEKCTYPNEPCRHPDKAYPSMEAYGLFVSKVCELSKIPYYSGENTVTYTSCFLLE